MKDLLEQLKLVVDPQEKLRECVTKFTSRRTLNEGERWDKDKDNLYQHCLRELNLAGLFGEDSVYGGMLGESIMKMVEAFCKEGHSGGSASIVLQIMPRLLAWENLTPITDDPEDWMNVEEHYGKDGAGHGMQGTWQCRRNPSLFSTDGGKTYYDLDESPRVIHNSETKKK